MKTTRLATLCAALGLASFLSLNARADVYSDASNDLFDNGLSNLDITSFEVTNSATSITFTVTTRGFQNWTKYLIGIRTAAASAASSSTTGNAWSRPASYAEGINFQIAAWVDGTTPTAQYIAYSSGSWNWGAATTATMDLSQTAANKVSWTVSLASLGLVIGDTIKFDIGTSGGENSDPFVDVASRSDAATSGWGNPSTGGPMLSYTIAALADSDNDGLPDSWENTYFGNLAETGSGDPDSDGLNNSGELTAGTNPTVADTDGDGLNDGAEVNTHGTNPLVADTDGDGVNDGAEVTAGTNPKKRNYTTITIAGTFNGFNPAPAADNSNVMNKDSEFAWSKRVRATGEAQLRLKFAVGTWDTQWGASASNGVAAMGGGDILAPDLGTGFFDITFNNDTLSNSIARVNLAPPGTYADFATAYGLASDSGSGDADGDGLVNSAEHTANTDPLNPDTDGDGLADGYDGVLLAPVFVVDGVRDSNYLAASGSLTNGPATNSVQTTTALTGANALANLAIRQVGGNLHLFVGGTPLNTQAPGSTDGTKNHFLLFIDSKAGGVNQFASNTINTNNNSDASQVNGLAGMKLESGFEADYVIKITGGTNNAWVNVHNLQSGTSFFVGESATGVRSGDIVRQVRSSFPASSGTPYAEVTSGTEMVLNLEAMGVDLNTSNPAAMRLMVLLASENSQTGYDQVLPPAPSGVTTLSAVDFNNVAGSQTLVFQPRGFPVLTVTPSSLFSSLDDLTGGDPYPGTAVDSAGQPLAVFSDFEEKMQTISGSVTVTYRAIDPTTGWFSTATRTVVDGAPSLNFANLQFPTNSVTINTLGRVEVFARVGGVGVTDGATAVSTNRIPGFRAQIGISANTNSPATDSVSWTWTDAAYEGERDLGREDYKLTFSNRPVGTYYYASRFSLNGGTNWTVGALGGPWQEGTSTSAALGTFTVENVTVNYANVQWPPNGTLAKTAGLPFQIFAQVYVAGVTEADGPPTYSGFKAQIGTSTGNNDPSAAPNLFTWTDAVHSKQDYNNDEYVLEIAAGDVSAGTYYYASRFSVDNGVTWSYGGISADGASKGAWGGANGNGVLRVGNVPTNLSLSASALDENNSVGAVVGTLTTTDADSSDTFTYTLVTGIGSTDNNSFTIDGASLKAGVVFDYETKASYSIRVRTTDSLGFSYEKAFTVTVSDVSETPAGSTFSGWLGSSPASAELVKQYAFGAATPGSAVNRLNLPAGGVIGSNLTLTYYVRSEATNPNLVVPQVHTNLVESNAWTAVAGSNITTLGTNTVDGVEVIQKRATVPVDGTRKFLRLIIAE